MRGASLKAYQNPEDEEATKCIGELMDAIDAYIPEPERAVDLYDGVYAEHGFHIIALAGAEAEAVSEAETEPRSSAGEDPGD